MLKILGGLFAARQRGVEDGAAPPTRFVSCIKSLNRNSSSLHALPTCLISSAYSCLYRAALSYRKASYEQQASLYPHALVRRAANEVGL